MTSRLTPDDTDSRTVVIRGQLPSRLGFLCFVYRSIFSYLCKSRKVIFFSQTFDSFSIESESENNLKEDRLTCLSCWLNLDVSWPSPIALGLALGNIKLRMRKFFFSLRFNDGRNERKSRKSLRNFVDSFVFFYATQWWQIEEITL